MSSSDSTTKQLFGKAGGGGFQRISKIAEEAIEMILPRNYKSIAEDRETKRTAATLGFDDIVS
jgi:hypothetical protein